MGLRLAVIGDLHYAAWPDETAAQASARDAFYGALLTRFFAHPADLHVALGDVTHTGSAEEWAGFMRLAGDRGGATARDFLFILGNHDTLARGRDAVLAQTGALRYTAREWPECRALFLDTARPSSPDDYSGFVDREQLAWLGSLAGRPPKPTLVFGHHPFPATTEASERPMMHLANGPALEERLRAFGTPIVYFNGHNHSHSLAAAQAGPEGWRYVQSAAALCVPSFRTVEVTGQGIRVGTVVPGDADLRERAAAVRDAMPGYWHNPRALGAPADHELWVPFAPGV